MLQHLETIQVIVNALVEEDYELARGLTELHLGFFMHRQEMTSQKAENFPHGYQELAHRIERRLKSWRASSPRKI